MHHALKGRLLNKLEEAPVVDILCDLNVMGNLLWFNNFINFIYKVNDKNKDDV